MPGAGVTGGTAIWLMRRLRWRPLLWCATALLHVVLNSAVLTVAKAQDSQEELRTVQRALQVKGYDVGSIDGIMGPRTKAALEEFQRKSGLAVTGIADTPTLRALTVTEVPQAPRPETPAGRTQAQPTPPYQYPPAPKSQTPASTTQRVPATSPPTKDTGNSNIGWIVLLALLVAGVVLWRRRSKARQQTVGQPQSHSNASSGGFRIVVTSDPVSPRRPTPIFSGPSAGTLKEQSERCWVRAGRPLTVAGYELQGGLLYVGKELDRQDGGGVDSCLINPTLPVSGRSGLAPNVPYYPSYSFLEPHARGGYLQWLASGRSSPDANIGYVFLYFYGLERRLMLDQVADDHRLIVAEVDRLRRVYEKSYSVIRYAGLLLDAAKLLQPARRHYEDDAPVGRHDYELPFSVRLAVGQLLADAKPIPWNWMYAWVLNDPQTNLRTVHTRAEKEVAELFRLRFGKKYPDGFKLNAPKARLRWSYRAASGSFHVDLQPQLGDLPDVAGLTGPTNKMREILDGCAEELEGYSRFLGRRPNGRGSLQALCVLPAELAQKADGGEVKKLREWLDALLANGPASVESGELMTRLAIEANYGKAAVRSCADALQSFQVALMPNPRVSLQLPKIGQPFVLYRCGSDEIPDSEIAPFRLASLALTFAAFIAHADSALSPEESKRLVDMVQAAPGLSDRGRLDLGAHLRWLQAVPAEPAALRSRLSAFSAEDRHQLGLVALSAASADVSVHPAEIKALQRIYKMLGLNEDGVLSDLHSAMTVPTELTAIQIAPAPAAGFAIPKSPDAHTKPGKPGEIYLDPDRLKHIGESTQRVNEILSKVFTEDDAEAATEKAAIEEVAEEPSTIVVDSGQVMGFEGLDGRYKGFLTELLSRPEWTRPELDMLARAHELMTDGALEAINEWAFDQYGDALVEDGDPATIQRHVIGQPATVEHVQAQPN